MPRLSSQPRDASRARRRRRFPLASGRVRALSLQHSRWL